MCPNYPVWIASRDLQRSVVNSRALELIKVPFSLNGIQEDENGVITGILEHEANAYAKNKIMNLYTFEEKCSMIRDYINEKILSMGVTTVEGKSGYGLDKEITHPHAVKVVLDHQNFALYFSRATIPYVRDKNLRADYYKHHGIYAYRRDFLDVFTKLPEGKLEKLEALEQLRALEYGYKIKVVVTPFDSVEVDNQQELERVRQILLENK